MSSARAEGAWTQASAASVLAQTKAYIEAGSVDLSGVTDVDSTAVSLLLELTRRARAAGKSLRFVHAPPRLATLTAFFDVNEVLQLTESPL